MCFKTKQSQWSFCPFVGSFLLALLILVAPSYGQQQTGMPLQKGEQAPNPNAPPQSEVLKDAKDQDSLVRTFKTMYVETHDVSVFGPDQIVASLVKNPDFATLNIQIVNDRRLADTVLSVGYTFAWDFPFVLRHQNTSLVLTAGKGQGPFSGPAGARDVANKFVSLMKKSRTSLGPASKDNDKNKKEG
ncbi:MAG TPA: hypothetical protein VKZ53_25235 [Candidatus Angelobacter sp.]|nr:hypothetical protein [Candidatus Angelobacter sp.]